MDNPQSTVLPVQRRITPFPSRSRIPKIPTVAGIGLTIALALCGYAAGTLEEAIFGHAMLEPLVIALLLGVLYANTVGVPTPWKAGVRFSSRTLLNLAIVALGATVDLSQVAAAGGKLFVLALMIVGLGTAGTYVLGRILGLPDRLAILVAVGNSICGNSAIAATAPGIGATQGEVAASISLTAIVGVVQVIGLPLLAVLADMGHYRYGVLAGLTIYSVPQVIAAGFQVSTISANVAVLTKLTRVLLLGPVVFVTALIFSRKRAKQAFSLSRINTYVPWFLAGFLLFALLKTSGSIPTSGASTAKTVSTGLFVISMAALGLEVDLRSMAKTLPRVALVVSVSVVCLTIMAALGIQALSLSA